ncbi:hypothetical protein Atai01_53050 [Amycolatopsis taiwanensis]|uniref:Uncharacterized protein n=1 Tax=Amycolatopsis taiwanensis TaxID=342230 RepID=A0A9W6R4E0_9PSEU|nr:hypothetical protein Atai01_53050 [Amycolatopsis taiwanensis]
MAMRSASAARADTAEHPAGLDTPAGLTRGKGARSGRPRPLPRSVDRAGAEMFGEEAVRDGLGIEGLGGQ